MTAPVAALYLLPWHGQSSSLPPWRATVQPMWVQMALNALTVAGGGLGDQDDRLAVGLGRDGPADRDVGRAGPERRSSTTREQRVGGGRALLFEPQAARAATPTTPAPTSEHPTGCAVLGSTARARPRQRRRAGGRVVVESTAKTSRVGHEGSPCLHHDRGAVDRFNGERVNRAVSLGVPPLLSGTPARTRPRPGRRPPASSRSTAAQPESYARIACSCAPPPRSPNSRLASSR